jgi:hypothetical protein
MQFFSSDDPLTRIGEAIGSVIAVGFYVLIVALLIVQFFYS